MLVAQHPSQLKLGLSNAVMDNSVSKRLLACVVAALRANGKLISNFGRYLFMINTSGILSVGSTGCHVHMTSTDALSMDFYNRLGFTEVKNLRSEQEVYLGRIF